MDQKIKYVVDRLYAEIKKDLLFFGLCGIVVGYLFIFHSRLKEKGITQGNNWADSLFSDFVSLNAFGLVFFGLIGVAAIATILKELGFQLPRLEAAVIHLETRLAQITSAIISFTLGLSALALFHSVMTVTLGGIKLALLAFLFDMLLLSGFFSAVLVVKRNKPFDKWWGAAIMLAFVAGFLVWFIVAGVS